MMNNFFRKLFKIKKFKIHNIFVFRMIKATSSWTCLYVLMSNNSSVRKVCRLKPNSISISNTCRHFTKNHVNNMPRHLNSNKRHLLSIIIFAFIK